MKPKDKGKAEARHKANASPVDHVNILDDLYILSVDFVKYPTLHKQLLKLAEEEEREPEAQLRYMLKVRLKDMEEKAKEEAHA